MNHFLVDFDIFLQLLLSFGIGTAIGIEREYRSKAAGLRTMIMICVGSTIFTQLSIMVGSNGNPDRIASAIVSGIGFLGAGVIFKDGLNVSGLTTATTIWICAALGMAVGAGQYFIALVGSGVVLIVLVPFEKVKEWIEKRHQTRTYRIAYDGHPEVEQDVRTEMQRLHLKFISRRNLKMKEHCIVVYEVIGGESSLDELNHFLRTNNGITSYEY